MGSSVQTNKIIVNETVRSAYESLIDVITDNFDSRIACIVEVCASTIAVLTLDNVYNPVGLILVDNPSTGKTTALSFFYGLKMVYRSDSFTPSAFVSHAANRRKKDLSSIDLLPRIKNKCLIVPELSPLFGQKPDDLQKSIAILTRVFDGEGYRSDSGPHGERGYTGEYMFTMMGATPPLKKGIWKMMGQFGSRLICLTLDSATSPNERMKKSFNDIFFTGRKNFKQKLGYCRQAIETYFDILKSAYFMKSFHSSISWDIFNDPPDIKLQINNLAEFTARARSSISIWDSKNQNRKRKYDFAQLILEGPHRLANILYSLARAHALICGRDRLSEDDMAIVTQVALSSMPNDRRQVISLLLDDPGSLKLSPRGIVTTTEIEKTLTVSQYAADKVINELRILGIGQKETGKGNQSSSLRIVPDYEWITSDVIASYKQKWRQMYDVSF